MCMDHRPPEHRGPGPATHKRGERATGPSDTGEGLTGPQNEPKTGRLWLNDRASGRRGRPMSGPMRSRSPSAGKDVLQARTHDGRAFRTLNAAPSVRDWAEPNGRATDGPSPTASDGWVEPNGA